MTLRLTSFSTLLHIGIVVNHKKHVRRTSYAKKKQTKKNCTPFKFLILGWLDAPLFWILKHKVPKILFISILNSEYYHNKYRGNISVIANSKFATVPARDFNILFQGQFDALLYLDYWNEFTIDDNGMLGLYLIY